jgi:hypothetical protein
VIFSRVMLGVSLRIPGLSLLSPRSPRKRIGNAYAKF